MSEWIPLSERLPELGKDVLVCYKLRGTRYVSIGGLFGDGEFHGYDDEFLSPEGRMRRAVAWMPLPEPYDPNLSFGINVGGKCHRDCNRGYSEDKSVFREENDFCSKAERREE